SELINYYIMGLVFTDYYFSIAIVVVFISIFRWGIKGIITAPIIGLIASILKDDNLNSYIINILGNLGVITSYLFLKVIGKSRVSEDKQLLLIYIVIGYLGIILLKSIILLLWQNNLI